MRITFAPRKVAPTYRVSATALTRTINAYATNNNLLKNVKFKVSGEDTREGLAAVVSVKVSEPQFEGQTKGKLGNSEVQRIVDSFTSEALNLYLEENPDVAKRAVEKIVEAAITLAKRPERRAN